MSRQPIDEQLARVPLFSALSKAELERVSRLATPVTVPAGRVLLHEGEHGREFLVVVEGTVEVRRGDTLIATCGPGEFFGEISLLLDRPRTASVIAKTDATVEVIERRSFTALLSDTPALYQPLLKAAVARLAELEADAPA